MKPFVQAYRQVSEEIYHKVIPDDIRTKANDLGLNHICYSGRDAGGETKDGVYYPDDEFFMDFYGTNEGINYIMQYLGIFQ